MKADLKASISISIEQQKLIEEFIGAVKDFQEAVNRLTTISTAIDKNHEDTLYQSQKLDKLILVVQSQNIDREIEKYQTA